MLIIVREYVALIPCVAEVRCTYSFSEQPQTSYVRLLSPEQKDGTICRVTRFGVIPNQRSSGLRSLRPKTYQRQRLI